MTISQTAGGSRAADAPMDKPVRRREEMLMAMLHLLRHAKSSWKEDVEDRERGLNRRGREAARRIGRTFPAAIGPLDLALCSSARRTRETLDLVLAAFSPQPLVLFEDGLYLASREDLLARLSRLDPKHENVLLIGHNPGLHELALALAATGSPAYPALAGDKFPSAARASFEIRTPWAALGRARHDVVDYVTP